MQGSYCTYIYPFKLGFMLFNIIYEDTMFFLYGIPPRNEG